MCLPVIVRVHGHATFANTRRSPCEHALCCVRRWPMQLMALSLFTVCGTCEACVTGSCARLLRQRCRSAVSA